MYTRKKKDRQTLMYAQKKCIVHQDAEDCEYNVGIANTRLSKFDSTSSQVVAPLTCIYLSCHKVGKIYA